MVADLPTINPAVSVIIPTRNRLPLLQEAVTSVVRQNYPAWECIVVDDASGDGTWAWLESITDIRIRAVHLERHSERSAGRNAGLAAAQGDLVLFLDDDDRLRPHALERMVAALRRHSGAVAAVAARSTFDNMGRGRRMPHPRRTTVRTVWPEVLFGWIAGQGQCLFRIDVLRRCGGWSEQMVAAEDQELWLRLGCAGPAVILPFVALDNRRHAQQSRPDNLSEIEEEFRASFVSSREGHARRLAKAVLTARGLASQGARAYQQQQFASAARLYIRALWCAPPLASSPLVGPTLWAFVIKALAGVALGRRSFNAGKNIKAVARQASRRNSTGQVQMTDSSSER